MAVLVMVGLIGHWVDDLCCRTIDRSLLMDCLSNTCGHLVPAILSETVRLESRRDKWFNHFRLHVWLARLSLDMNGSEKPLEISASTKIEARL